VPLGPFFDEGDVQMARRLLVCPLELTVTSCATWTRDNWD